MILVTCITKDTFSIVKVEYLLLGIGYKLDKTIKEIRNLIANSG